MEIHSDGGECGSIEVEQNPCGVWNKEGVKIREQSGETVAAAERGAVSRIIAEEQEEEDAEGRGSREPDWGWAYCVSWLPWGLCTGRCWPVCSRKAQASVCWD